MTDCTDVCDVVTAILITLGFTINEGDESHDDILAALANIKFMKKAQATPPDPQRGREPDKVKSDTCEYSKYKVVTGCIDCPYNCQDKVKPLAQYLGEYIENEAKLGNLSYYVYGRKPWRKLLEQALDAYESTEQVKIRIERV